MNTEHRAQPTQLRFQRAKDQIRALAQRLTPHQRLPSRPELTRKLGFARTTIDRAISELIGEKELYAIDGSGTYVAEQTPRTSTDRPEAVSGLVGVIVNRIDDPNVSEIVRAIEDTAQSEGFGVLLGNEQGDPKRHLRYVNQFIETGVKGLILFPGRYREPNEELHETIRSSAVPFVFGIRNIESIPAPEIIANNFHGGFIATRHLIHSGYRRIAFLATVVYSSVHERLQGYMSALHLEGRQLDDCLIAIEPAPDRSSEGYQQASRLLDLSSGAPDAFFCFNDGLAHGVYQAAIERGLVIGRDVGVVGYDDAPICEQLPVELTSVRFPKYEMGRQLYATLARMMGGETISRDFRRVLMPDLVVRQSSQRSST